MKKFFSIIVLALVLVLPFAWYNYHHDISGLFDRDFSKVRLDPSLQIVKMRWILDHPDRYDAFLMGSSRVGRIHPDELGDGCRWYNLYGNEASLPQEWLENLKILLKHDVKVKKLMLGLDDASFQLDPHYHDHHYAALPYREHQQLLTDLKYLLRIPVAPPTEESLFNAGRRIYDIEGTGCVLSPWADEDIEAHPGRSHSDQRFYKVVTAHEDLIEPSLWAMREILRLARENGIEVTVFYNPIFKYGYLDGDAQKTSYFRRRLAAITPFYDFEGLNPITTEPDNFYDNLHYRPFVGSMMLRRMYEDGENVPAWFGTYVTEETVDAHNAALEAEIDDWLRQRRN